MYSSSDWRKALTKLLELTSLSEIKWEPSDISASEEHRQVVGAFEVKYSERTFVITQLKYQSYLDETEWFWETEYDLGIYEPAFSGMRRIATAPNILTLSSLYSAAEDSYAYSKNALAGLLS